jgi:hypothetical protein
MHVQRGYPRVEINWHRAEDPKNRPKEGLSEPSEGIFGRFLKSCLSVSTGVAQNMCAAWARISAAKMRTIRLGIFRGGSWPAVPTNKLILALNIELKIGRKKPSAGLQKASSAESLNPSIWPPSDLRRFCK